MSQATQTPQRAGDSLPAWVSAGIVGLALGGGGTYLVMQNYVVGNKATAAAPTMPMAGGSSMMGMGGMGGGMMGGGGGMMGGGGGGGVKRGLTSLVGKLELLSRPDLKLNVELADDQKEKIAAKLDQLAKAEKMTAEDAEAHVADLESLLTDEQKATLGLVGLPPPARGGAGGGGPPGAGGAPRAGGPPGAAAPPGGAGPSGITGPPGMGGMMGGGGPPPDENPFTQEVNEKRIKDLLGRLSGAPAEKEAAPEEKEKPADPAETKAGE
jgi:hypothetical protein